MDNGSVFLYLVVNLLLANTMKLLSPNLNVYLNGVIYQCSPVAYHPLQGVRTHVEIHVLNQVLNGLIAMSDPIIICKGCNEPIGSEAEFCFNCGEPIERDEDG